MSEELPIAPDPTPNPLEPPQLSVVIPAWNEARRIAHSLAAISDFVRAQSLRCEIVVVDDGSTDATVRVVTDAAREVQELRLHRLDRNRGKGFAVRQGMLAATGSLILVSDADLSAPIGEFEKLRAWIDEGFDVVIGSRDLADSVLDPPQPLLRRWAAWAFRSIRRGLILPGIRDTQCGFKLFTRQAARAVFSVASVDGWLFDCEVLALAACLGYRIKETGIVWGNDRESRVSLLRELCAAVPTVLRIRRLVARCVTDCPPNQR